MNRKIKKYNYLVRKFVTDYYHRYKKRKLSKKISNHALLDLRPLSLNKLPWPVRWDEVLNHNRLVVEIGCGHGELLEFLANKNDKGLHLGFEITKTYTQKTANKVRGLENAFIFMGDGYSSALNLFTDKTIDQIYILFPDPWHKKKHHKRRPITSDWFRAVFDRLKDGGEIYFASDWVEYYKFVLDEAEKVADSYKIDFGTYNPKDAGLVPTHYYKKWLEMGREFDYVSLKKKRVN